MSGSLYEGYKDALRRGHVAALRGHLDVALAAYGEASRIAPGRALPHVGLGGVLARLSRVEEALAAYRTALDGAPDDEGALRGQADLLAAEGRPAEAAASLDRLASVLERAGRMADACDVARRALELAESRGRRRLVQSLVGRLRESSGDPTAAQALERALSVLEIDPVTAPGPSATADAGGPPLADRAPHPKASQVPPPDPIALSRAFEAAVDAGNLDEARKQAVASAAAHRAVGQFHASIDACYEALAIAPADPGIHFALAQLYLDRGWRTLAADKLVLIGRLAQLTGDTATRARLCDLAVRRFPDDARLAAMCLTAV
ncbi:MAG: tetratricopeptide repeat protein [Candidatus Limnocylindrales bacterium]|nr:tetratricopeptide repeat protein [Candidatus Limnocylindrales bacterium]